MMGCMRSLAHEEALNAVRQFYAQHGRLPRWREWEHATSGRPCAKTINRRWGWRELLAEAISVRPDEVDVSWEGVLDYRAPKDARRARGGARGDRAMAARDRMGADRAPAVSENVRAVLRELGGSVPSRRQRCSHARATTRPGTVSLI